MATKKTTAALSDNSDKSAKKKTQAEATASKQPDGYQSGYDAQIRQTMQKIIDREPFSYDVNADKLYAQYKDNYTALGNRAMQDTMGNAALLTGGYGNSYGVTAGQQAYNSYMQKLSDVVPELEQLAYERWLSEGDALYDRLAALQNADNTAYGRYRDTVEDYYNDRDYERSVYESDRKYQYQKEQDALAQSNWQKQFDRDNYENDRDYQRSVYENDRDYQRSVYENDRKYMNEQLEQAVDKEKDSVAANGRFSPENAYEFIKKYDNVILSEEELIESLYQMFGEQDGFYDWLASTSSDSASLDNGLEILYRLHPELRPEDNSGLSKSEMVRRAFAQMIDLANKNQYAVETAGRRADNGQKE